MSELGQSLKAAEGHLRSPVRRRAALLASFYALVNVISACGIVFINKLVFTKYHFHFTCALTWIHTCFTYFGMSLFAYGGFYQKKKVSQLALLPLAAAYVGYIVLCNFSLKVNTVSFYQIMKIAVAPTMIMLEVLLFRKWQSPSVVAAVAIVCLGTGIATVMDSQMVSNAFGVLVGCLATVCTALYQIWAGSKQNELQLSSMQLLQQYSPQAIVLLSLLVPVVEPLDPKTDSLLIYKYTPASLTAIFVSAFLGLLVSLSTFLVIGATSSLTYNVVGHVKTIIILTGGCVIFGDQMPWKKFLGICIALGGILWYTQLKLQSPKSHVDDESAPLPLTVMQSK